MNYKILVSVLVVLALIIPPAHAYKLGMIGIGLSQSCLSLSSLGTASSCPTYQDLIQLDSSKQEISGKFVLNDDGNYYREASQLRNAWKWYDQTNNNEYRIFVDPSPKQALQLKMIWIHPNLDKYVLSHKVIDNTVVLEHTRYIDNCRVAQITSKNWQSLIPDTILFMRNNCQPNFTLLNTSVSDVRPYVEHDITTSQKWIHEAWLKNITENCLQEYGKC
jgi:hypothetical protein